jgi:hypothetical protein
MTPAKLSISVSISAGRRAALRRHLTGRERRAHPPCRNSTNQSCFALALQVGALGIATWQEALAETVTEETMDEWNHSEWGFAKMLWHTFGQEPFSQMATNWLDSFLSPLKFTPVRGPRVSVNTH